MPMIKEIVTKTSDNLPHFVFLPLKKCRFDINETKVAGIRPPLPLVLMSKKLTRSDTPNESYGYKCKALPRLNFLASH